MAKQTLIVSFAQFLVYVRLDKYKDTSSIEAINGVNYRIADFDYYFGLGTGIMVPGICNTHHLVLWQDQIIDGGIMYATPSDAGSKGYISCYFRTTVRITGDMKRIKDGFGDSHIMTYLDYITNAYNNNIWELSSVELPSEIMLYGSNAVVNATEQDMPPKSSLLHLGPGQFPLCLLDPYNTQAYGHYWLRDVSSKTGFTTVNMKAYSSITPANYDTVKTYYRPYFCLCA